MSDKAFIAVIKKRFVSVLFASFFMHVFMYLCFFSLMHTHTHTHRYIHTYIYCIYTYIPGDQKASINMKN